jgi:MFS family permease
MLDAGVPGKNVPASMAIAQAAQAIATFFLLGLFLGLIGFKWTLTIGAGCWLIMYVVYIAAKAPWPIILSQALHGLAYVFFMIVGQIFMESAAAPEIRSSMQALIFAATVGVGLFLGTQFAGIVMDQFSVEGKFQWGKIWLVPAGVMLAGVLALLVLFKEPPKPEDNESAQTAPSVRHITGEPRSHITSERRSHSASEPRGLSPRPGRVARHD